jgi:putative FmdB family regulatory protein
MPIYEYQCLDCDRAFEKIITSAAAPEPILCDHCGSAKVQKKISATSYRLANATSSPIPAGALSGCSSRSGFS